LNRLRDRKHLHWLDEEAIPDSYDTASVPTPASQLDARQLADLIRQLPAGYQTVFNLHAVEGYSHVEIATLLGISEGTSRSQYLRARRLLMEKINQLDVLKTDSHVGRA
jgi:RNA polymerase sigma-70 factor (ECF subfamily)